MAYGNRGQAKVRWKDYKGATEDYSKAIELNPDYASAYGGRGFAKYNLNDIGGACKDWRIAASLGKSNVIDIIRQLCE